MNNSCVNALMIIDTLGVGGAEVSLNTLTRSMVSLGCNVVVLVIKNDIVVNMGNSVNIEKMGYKKYKILPSLYMNAVRLKKNISSLEKKYGKFNLKVANLTLSHKLVNAAGLSDVYYCMHENFVASNLKSRSGFKKIFRRLRICRLYRNKDIITVSRGIEDSFKAIKGLYVKSIKTIYNPIDMNVIRELSQEYNPYGEFKYIVHVGRLAPEKRHDVLLNTYMESNLDCILILVGDGPDKEAINKKIFDMGLSDRVVISGFLSNPYPVIRDAELLVLSSDYEGFGVVLAEALCLKTAVVSTDCESGPAEIMISDLSNYLVPTGNDIELARMMKKAIADVSNNKYPVGQGNVERFSPESIAKKYIDLGKDVYKNDGF